MSVERPLAGGGGPYYPAHPYHGTSHKSQLGHASVVAEDCDCESCSIWLERSSISKGGFTRKVMKYKLRTCNEKIDILNNFVWHCFSQSYMTFKAYVFRVNKKYVFLLTLSIYKILIPAPDFLHFRFGESLLCTDLKDRWIFPLPGEESAVRY